MKRVSIPAAVSRAAAVAVAGLTIMVGAAACGGAAPPKQGRPPVAVTTSVAETRSVPIEVSTVGSVVPFATVTVQPRVAGQITSIRFKEGQTVEKGALLFEIDSAPYAAAAAQAEAVLARDVAQQENADLEAQRYAGMLEQKLVSPQEAETKVAAAKALRATVVADQAALANAQLNLSYTRVTSPITGRTDKRQVDVGNLVQPGSAAVVTIRQVSPIQVSFSLPQELLTDVQNRMRRAAKPTPTASAAAAAVTPQAAGPSTPSTLEVTAILTDGTEVKGALTFLGGAVDSSTGSVPCKADFENKDDLLWPGAYVRVVLRLGMRNDAVVVPAAAVQTSQQGPFAFVVKADSTVEMRPVTTAPAPAGLLIVEKGVAAGEKVVVDGQLSLVPGAKVVERPAVGTKANADAPPAPGAPGARP